MTIALAPRTARAIDLAIGERTEGPVFLARDGRQLGRHAAGRVVRRTARRAGLAKLATPHTLRHAFITAALDAGVPLHDVQEAASHADTRTTMRYDRARSSLDGIPLTSSPPTLQATPGNPGSHPSWRRKPPGRASSRSASGDDHAPLPKRERETADRCGFRFGSLVRSCLSELGVLRFERHQ